jgi:hypothetical protein
MLSAALPSRLESATQAECWEPRRASAVRSRQLDTLRPSRRDAMSGLLQNRTTTSQLFLADFVVKVALTSDRSERIVFRTAGPRGEIFVPCRPEEESNCAVALADKLEKTFTTKSAHLRQRNAAVEPNHVSAASGGRWTGGFQRLRRTPRRCVGWRRVGRAEA